MKLNKVSFLFFVVSCLQMPVRAQLEDGAVYKIRNVASGRYMQVQDASLKNGALIRLWDNQDANHFRFKAKAVKGGNYRLQNINSNKYLAVENASRSNYGRICQWDANLASTLWKLETVANGFKIKNVNSNLLIGVEGGGRQNNALLVQWNDDGAQDKIWQFEKVNVTKSTAGGPKQLIDVVLNYIAVLEGTRNRMDNGDCARVFGHVKTELWELDEHNEMKVQLASYNNMPELLFNQQNYQSPPPVAISYRTNMDFAANNQVGKVTYNVPEVLLQQRRLMLVVKTHLGTRHKDNDFATFDCLGMPQEIQSAYILSSDASLRETIQASTDLSASGRDMHFQDFVVPFAIFQRTDDTHRIWVGISANKK